MPPDPLQLDADTGTTFQLSDRTTIDLAKRSDARDLIRCLPLTFSTLSDDIKATAVAAAVVLVKRATNDDDRRGMANGARIIKDMAALNQTDIHANHKNQRLDAGQATENVQKFVRLEVLPPRLLTDGT